MKMQCNYRIQTNHMPGYVFSCPRGHSIPQMPLAVTISETTPDTYDVDVIYSFSVTPHQQQKLQSHAQEEQRCVQESNRLIRVQLVP